MPWVVNPCERLPLPSVEGRRERIASPEEAARLLAALPLRDRALYGTAFFAGLRMGELRALRWEHIDLAAGLVLVEGAMDERGTLIAPKSRAGRRRVPIVAALREVLTEYRGKGAAEGFVFGPSPERPFTPSAVYRRVRTAWRRAELEPIGLHEARHTFASVLIAAGVNAKAITTYMGHSSVQVTFDLYGTLMPGNEQEAVALVDAYLERADARGRLKQLW